MRLKGMKERTGKAEDVLLSEHEEIKRWIELIFVTSIKINMQ